jgi:hypothetical protein
VTIALPRDLTPNGTEEFDLVINAFDVDTKLKQSRTLHATVVPNAQSSTDSVDVTGMLTLPPGRYQVRVGVTETSLRKSASVYTDVEVPNFSKDQVSLSGIVVSPIGALKSSQLANLLPVMPRTQRTFGSEDEVEAFWRVYQLSKSPQNVTLTISVLDHGGGSVSGATETRLATFFDPSRTVDEHFRLPLDKLPAGQYVLAVKAAADRVTATRQIAFSRR